MPWLGRGASAVSSTRVPWAWPGVGRRVRVQGGHGSPAGKAAQGLGDRAEWRPQGAERGGQDGAARGGKGSRAAGSTPLRPTAGPGGGRAGCAQVPQLPGGLPEAFRGSTLGCPLARWPLPVSLRMWSGRSETVSASGQGPQAQGRELQPCATQLCGHGLSSTAACPAQRPVQHGGQRGPHQAWCSVSAVQAPLPARQLSGHLDF